MRLARTWDCSHEPSEFPQTVISCNLKDMYESKALSAIHFAYFRTPLEAHDRNRTLSDTDE